MRVLTIPHIWLNMTDSPCLTLTHILQNMKTAGILQKGPRKDICAQNFTELKCGLVSASLHLPPFLG